MTIVFCENVQRKHRFHLNINKIIDMFYFSSKDFSLSFYTKSNLVLVYVLGWKGGVGGERKRKGEKKGKKNP